MTDKTPNNQENWYASIDKTSATDDRRIQSINILPPPEHLIRFFPIANTPMENLSARLVKEFAPSFKVVMIDSS